MACFAMPIIAPAQLREKPYDFKQLQEDRYPGSVYPLWDSVAKLFNWYSPIRGQLNLFSPQSEKTGNALSANASQLFQLTKDINDESNAYPSNYQPQFYNQRYAVLNGVAYFTADNGVNGSELWRSDGTDAGTYLVKDVEQGAASSVISDITTGNGKIFFTATTTNHGTQPWVSDGTEAGTHILKDISGYTFYGIPGMYTAAGNKVFFFLGDDQLWVTDGTESGTKQISISYEYFAFKQPVAAGAKFFFTTESSNYGRQLWVSNGTDAGTYRVKQVDYSYTGPQQLTAYKGKLYFSFDEWWSGRRLWVSDGTEAGTYQLADNVRLLEYNLVYNGQPDPQMAIYNNALYFIGYDPWNYTGFQLFKYSFDNSGGAVLVKLLNPFGDANIQPYEIVSYQNGVAFKVTNDDGSATLWTTKGSDADTKVLKNFPTINGKNFGNLYNASGYLTFEAYSETSGYELWKSNGTQGGTSLISDIFPGTGSSYPYFTTSININTILFSAKKGSIGVELWKSDGTQAGTVIVKDINNGNSESSIITSGLIANTADGVVFSAYTPAYGSEPYYSDGTTAGTNLISDILPAGSSRPYSFKSVKNNVYFLVDSSENGLAAIYMLNGSNKQLVKIFEAPANSYRVRNNYAIADNGIVFFQLRHLYNYDQNDIWRTDGTQAGSFVLKSSNSYAYGAGYEMVTIGNIAYFPYADQYYGTELYKSDGTVNGTRIVSDTYAGSYGSFPYSLFNYNGALYFGAADEDGVTYLWKTNGTFVGTKKVAQVRVSKPQSDGNSNNVYCISKGLLYFSTADYSESALWVTNGTSTGTKIVRTINANIYSNRISNLTDVNGTLYFSADDGIYGNELWASNGSFLGTILVKDISAGAGSTSLSNFCLANDKLYFVANGALWSSTGPGNKTKPVSDAGLEGVSLIDNVVAAGSKLFLSGYTGNYGAELYVGDLGTQTFASTNIVTKKITTPAIGTLSPNPVTDVANILLPNAKKAVIAISDNLGRIVWKQNDIRATQIQISMQKLPAGIYFIKITNEAETQTIKVIKQ